MEGHQLEIGRTYAFREKRSTSSPLLKVKLLDKVGRKGKLKVRFEDGPHPGLEEYVSTRQVVCGWGDRRAVLRDWQREERLAEYENERGDDKALRDAVEAVHGDRRARLRLPPRGSATHPGSRGHRDGTR
jgi:hypothetical protein